MSTPKRIGIAVVEHGQRYLVGIRGPDVPLPGYAEFPGGKCLPDETADACAIRECFEETGLQIVIQRLLERLEFEYPHGRVDLTFMLCHPTNPGDVCDDHQGFRWVSVDGLKRMKFPDANRSVVDLLINLAPTDGSKPCPA